MNRLGIDKRLIASGTQCVKSDKFLAHEVRSKITVDRKTIVESFIRRNHLDKTINDEIMACQEKLAKLRIMNKLG